MIIDFFVVFNIRYMYEIMCSLVIYVFLYIINFFLFSDFVIFCNIINSVYLINDDKKKI